MKLISVEYYQDGFEQSKATGKPVKRIRKRLALECPACKQHVTRAGFGSVKAETCGCVGHEKHGLTSGPKKHPIYLVWHGIRTRCLNKNNDAWERYGGRGIKICKQWNDPVKFYKWAISNGWKPGLFLDRRNNDGNYCPSNCRWVTVLDSNRNRSICITLQQAKIVHALLDANINERTIVKTTGVKLWTVRNIRDGVCWRKDQLVPCNK